MTDVKPTLVLLPGLGDDEYLWHRQVEALRPWCVPQVRVLERQQAVIMASPGHMTALTTIACPTLIVCGLDDPVTPVERSRELAVSIPRARLEVLERCGHYVPLEQPFELAELMRAWLTTAWPARV